MIMDMGKKIELLRKERGMTLEELGNKVGVGKSTVRKWENGMIANMRRDKIAKIADALGVSPANLMGWDEPDQAEPEIALSAEETVHIKKYRVIDEIGKSVVDRVLDLEYERATGNVVHMDPIYNAGQIAAAGRGVYVDGIPGEIIKVKNKPDDATFVIGVSGDSMSPLYHNGDEVYVKKTTELLYGEIGVWQIGSEYFIKRYGPDGLHSENPNYPVMQGSPEMVLIGKVLGLVKR